MSTTRSYSQEKQQVLDRIKNSDVDRDKVSDSILRRRISDFGRLARQWRAVGYTLYGSAFVEVGVAWGTAHNNADFLKTLAGVPLELALGFIASMKADENKGKQRELKALSRNRGSA